MTVEGWTTLPERIQTARCLLRPFSTADADDVHAYRRDAEVVRYLQVAQPFRREDADVFVATQVLSDRHERCVWAMVQDGRVVGGVSLRIARGKRRAEVGYELARWLWGRGLMTEAVSAVIDEAFRRLPIIKITATATAANARSIRLLERLGMQREALLRQHWVHGGRVLDEVRYGLLRDKWEGHQATASEP